MTVAASGVNDAQWEGTYVKRTYWGRARWTLCARRSHLRGRGVLSTCGRRSVRRISSCRRKRSSEDLCSQVLIQCLVERTYNGEVSTAPSIDYLTPFSPLVSLVRPTLAMPPTAVEIVSGRSKRGSRPLTVLNHWLKTLVTPNLRLCLHRQRLIAPGGDEKVVIKYAVAERQGPQRLCRRALLGAVNCSNEDLPKMGIGATTR